MMVENGKQALEVLDQNTFDAVLMDVQMPEMDGFETTASIRAKERGTGQHLHIIGMTAHALKGDRERCLKTGMDGYISKPMSSSELMSVLSAVQSPAAKAGAFDLASSLRRVDDDLECFYEMAEMLLEDAPGQVAAIHEAIESQDAAKLQSSAHRLKGSLIPFDASAAADAVQALETMGYESRLTHAATEYRTLYDALQQLLLALQQLGPFVNPPPVGDILTTGSTHRGNSPCTV